MLVESLERELVVSSVFVRLAWSCCIKRDQRQPIKIMTKSRIKSETRIKFLEMSRGTRGISTLNRIVKSYSPARGTKISIVSFVPRWRNTVNRHLGTPRLSRANSGNNTLDL